MAKQKLPIAIAALVLGVSASCATNQPDKPSEEAAGQLEVALGTVPGDANCLQLKVAGSRTVDRSFDLKPGETALFSVSGLPVGPATVSANAFSMACSKVTSASVPTYVGDPVTTTLFPIEIAKVALFLRRNGRLSVSVDFEGAGSPFPAACVACLTKSCAEFIGGCDAAKGVATDGPGEGLSRSALCAETLSCVTSTHCGTSDLSVCYCGSPAGFDCIEGSGPTGPCRSTFDRAFEVASPLDVPVRFNDATFGGGAALSLLQCASDNCVGCL